MSRGLGVARQRRADMAVLVRHKERPSTERLSPEQWLGLSQHVKWTRPGGDQSEGPAAS